jgi:N-acetylneuraminate synthase
MEKTADVTIIAEAGVNHNGSLEMALRLVDVAADAGADVVKFQTFNTEKVISRSAPKAQYQMTDTDVQESQFDMVKKLELGEVEHRRIIEHCRKREIRFLSTPFDLDSVDLLARIFDLPCLKIPSGEISNAPLLLKAACTGKKIILSTGMSSLGDIETALGVLAFGYLARKERPSQQGFREAYRSRAGRRALEEKVILLHCTTEYPAPFEEVNLRAMDTMRAAFALPVGFSDHTTGIVAAVAAAARGAAIIEKHFTLDKSLPGPDHQASLDPGELAALVQAVRLVQRALGDGLKIPSPSELKNLSIARKSLVAAGPIGKGELFTEANLGIKRPGDGVSPLSYWDYLGTSAARELREDESLA